MEKWNKLCYYLSEKITTNIPEIEFEPIVEKGLEILGWDEYSGDFEIRPNYQLGSTKNSLKPDFVVKSNKTNEKLFVIEIKRPKVPLSNQNQTQLSTYMRQFKLEFGILIGPQIQIFYDGILNKNENAILLENIEFERENEKGKQFIELFSKDKFDKAKLIEFAKKSLEKINEKETEKEIKIKVLSNDFKEMVSQMILEKLSEEYEMTLVSKVLENIKIDISAKNIIHYSNLEITQSELPKSRFNDQKITEKETKIKPNFTRISGNKRTVNGMKIGQFVQYSFRKAYQQNLISDVEINNLQNPVYSKKNFNSNYEILKNKNRPIEDEYGRTRYYAKEVFCGNYHLTSQWFEPQWELLLNWLKKINYSYKNNAF